MAGSVTRAAGKDDRSCRVAIVGAGPAGIASCRLLREAGHQPVVFEGGSEVGGIWAPEPTNPVVYPNLVTNIPTICMQSFDLDFPAGLPSYVQTADLGKYMAMYADHFDLRPLVRFGTRVTSVRPLCSEEAEARGEAAWRVNWTPQQDGEPSAPQAQRPEGSSPQGSDTFDAVVVASGHYDTPYVPEIPGQAEWLSAAAPDREASHSVTYRGPGPYRDRTVLVVGGRSSAVDIARELRATAHWVYVLEKSCGPTPRTVGHCTHLPLGTRLQPDGHLALGDQVIDGPPVQSLILATGYGYRFPFLDAEELGMDFGPAKRYVAPLYMHVVHARRPTLGFVGLPLAVPAPLPLFEAQARMLAAHLRCSSFDVQQFQGWCERRRAEVGERSMDMHFLSDQAWDYKKELAQLSGMADVDLASYCRRVDAVRSVYADRCSRRPAYPWDDDDYRLCEYDVDWDSGTWSVRTPAGPQ